MVNKRSTTIADGAGLNAALIGGGKISEQHLGVLAGLPGVKVAGVCDLSPALARFTAERFGVPAWFTDYREMFDRGGADVVHVLTPPATHDRIVRDCLAAGAHVIVEKPIALTNRGFQDLWHMADARGLHLIENHNYRFNTPIHKLDDAIEQGRIGAVQEVEVRLALNIRGGGRYADANLPHPSHRLPAGIIHEFITHMAYLLLHFMPAGSVDRLDLLRSVWRNHGGGDLFKYDDLDVLLMSGGVHGRIRFSSNQWPDGFSVQVRGSDGMATAELFHPVCLVTRRRAVGQHLTPLVNAVSAAGNLLSAGVGGIWAKIRNRGAYEGLGRFLELTYRALENGDAPPVGYQQMDEAGRLVDAILAEENRL